MKRYKLQAKPYSHHSTLKSLLDMFCTIEPVINKKGFSESLQYLKAVQMLPDQWEMLLLDLLSTLESRYSVSGRQLFNKIKLCAN